MPSPAERGLSRREINARKRQSRRPSRHGSAAGAAPGPDYPREDGVGFPGLLDRAWRAALAAGELPAAVDALLTLDGHVPGDIQLRALRTADEAALKVLCGASWRGVRDGGQASGASAERAQVPPQDAVFDGEIALSTTGRILVRVPSQGPLAESGNLVAPALQVPWSAADLAAYRTESARAAARYSSAVVDCRQWLAAHSTQAREELLDLLKDAALRTAPFVLYQEDRQYTNFRDPNTLTGKTLWPGHPDCALSSLAGLPLDQWSDSEAVLVVCLTLLVRSASYARIEEANGTQLTPDHVGHLLEGVRRNYNAHSRGEAVPPAASARVADLDALAGALRARRTEVLGEVQLYREIHGPLMHKIERTAAPRGAAARHREAEVTARLTEALPLAGEDLGALAAHLAESPAWLTKPHGEFRTGLEALVHASVAASTEAFEADFAMSRGMRSLAGLREALRAQAWAEITDWGITDFFCCVVPDPAARRHFGDSVDRLADTAWAMSSRMQYNSWHFIAGNLPKVPAVVARDHFVPPTLPDIAFYSDQHHHGHVAAKVRFSIRSPQAVEIDGRRFNGFMDLRLLRCEGTPFGEQDLLAAHRVSAFVAGATGLAAELVAAGEEIEVTSFDSAWHGESVRAAVKARG
ncbi:hypothetical protein SLNWT_5136 [Streptomyces albus]|uniref:Uncharacterized protein n=1 Tax=Streptomyces albus (strain ATCC 21838 / DSM 41398 / FERM P-419 / JCM 4703 / NBRC 107858) TaxID=1081613 RepID=A0A0B5F564_STRA4|nr:hypothetical protein SLNWT_5136 [Streptomyces albus]AOU79815.1 hypothetical protein SLNHY_5124 [Streptomyces albus]AYN35539.1 hypothetical protein DUI70_5041 [Streptomyces albus]